MYLIRAEYNKLLKLITLVVSVLRSCKGTPETVQTEDQADSTDRRASSGASERTSGFSAYHSALRWGLVEVEMPNGTRHKFKDCVITLQNCIAWNYGSFGYKAGSVVFSFRPRIPQTWYWCFTVCC